MGTNHGGVNFGRRLPPIGGQYSTPINSLPQRRLRRRPGRPPRPQRRDRRHRRRVLAPQGSRGTPEAAQRRAPPAARREGRRAGSRRTDVGIAVDRLDPWNRRVRAEALRGYPLEDVVHRLGYPAAPPCGTQHALGRLRQPGNAADMRTSKPSLTSFGAGQWTRKSAASNRAVSARTKGGSWPGSPTRRTRGARLDTGRNCLKAS